MAEFLLEVLSEEVPARMQAKAAANLKAAFLQGLAAAGLTHGEARHFATPRRLILTLGDLPAQQPDAVEEKKGPKEGAPEQAIQGFMKANGLNDISEASLRETPKGNFYFIEKRIVGRPTAEVLAEILTTTLEKFAWPKSMCWGRNSFRWVRPLHNILALFDSTPLAGSLDLGATTLAFCDSTRGHRFLAPGSISVTDFADYQAKLTAAKVMIDPAERQAIILRDAKALATAEGLTLKDDPGLLSEVAGLVEWPVVLMGAIDPAFMDLPAEVLISAKRTHQKYFSLLGEDGKPAARFIFVANVTTEDQGAAIVTGNQRVLSARLADAQFFWNQDRKTPLPELIQDLEKIVYHAKLGTLAEKASRLQSLAVHLQHHLPAADRDKVRSAARLSKADLVTGMVGEFPELQGIMGRYYALADGESDEVAEAIAQHYAPLGPHDQCPSAPVAVLVALADKFDSLAGFWAIGETPTGSKDPFALRRAALGVIRLILENKLRLPLADSLEAALAGQHCDLDPSAHPGLVTDLLHFFADRLKVALREKGVRHDLIAAVFAVERPGGGTEDDLLRLLARVEALSAFLASDDGANLLVASRRAANIVRIESKKDKTSYDQPASVDILAETEEKQLFQALEAAQSEAAPALEAEDFTGAMAAMARLRQPLDAFFDKVTVNCEDADLRTNRLRLLAGIGRTLTHVADFSNIEST